MVADVTNNPVALVAQQLFRAALAEIRTIAKAVGEATAGLTGVVGQGVRGLVSSTIPAQFTPAVAVAHDLPDRGGRGTA